MSGDRRAGSAWPGRLAVGILAVVVIAAGVLAGLAIASGRDRPYEGRALLQAVGQDPQPHADGKGGTVDPTASAGLAKSTAARVDQADVVAAAQRIAPGRADVSAVSRADSATVEIVARSEDAAVAASQSRARALALRRLQTDEDRERYRRSARQLRGTVADLPRARVPDAVTTEIARLETASRSAIPLAIVRSGQVDRPERSPASWVFAVAGGAIGLLLVLLVALVRHRWRRRGRRIATIPELRRAKVPVLGVLPAISAYRRGYDGPFGLTDDDRELLRIVRRGLQDLDVEEAQVLLVTSAQAGAGKSTVAAGLAGVAAAAGQRVLLVECDLRLPSQADRLGLRPAPGLAEYLGGTAEPRQTLQEVRIGGVGGEAPSDGAGAFWVVTAGVGGATSLDGAGLDAMLGHVRSGYDLVVLDAPPLIGAADSGVLLGRADAVVVCARMGRITWDALESAVDVAVRSVGAERVGIVGTDVRSAQDPAGESRVYGSSTRG